MTNFGPREDCLSPLEEQRTFIILANAPGGRHLRARYDHPGGAAVQWSKENEEVVWSALGEYCCVLSVCLLMLNFLFYCWSVTISKHY